MKITLNSIRNVSEVFKASDDLTAIGVEELVTKIGAQLGAVEEVVELGPKYQGIIIAKVISCEKHPNADKLSVCLIDDNGAVKDVPRDDDGLVQVVCGAPNVRAGLTVAWLPPGATVPSTVDDDPFVLEARELRGVVSNGMLASPKELAIGDSHEGILEIDGKHEAGSDFAEAFKLSDEVVIDMENKMFTHRPDCFGWFGVTREIAGIQGKTFTSPDWYSATPELPKISQETLPVKVINELPTLVPRFTMVSLSNVKVGPSPVWLQVLLSKVGQKSINNIVDLTNYYMLLTGQPLHAYDYDKVSKLTKEDGATIIIRQPNKGEKIALLNGKEIEPREEAIMIATDDTLIGVGGAMGGTETEVDENTTNVIVECGNFDMYSIRRTTMAHGLFTDAVTRFNKGQSPLQCLAVLIKAASDMQRMGGGEFASHIIDENQVQAIGNYNSLHKPVALTVDFINSRLGLHLTSKEIATILENVEFNVEQEGNDLTVAAPFWRTDIEIPEDIVEEVGRLYGFDKLPLELPKRDLTPAQPSSLLSAKAAIRNRLSKAGANEILSYSFVHDNLLEKTGQDSAKAFQISNALSPDLQYYRISMMPSLLEKVHPNSKAGYAEFALFEIGKTHSLDHGQDDDGLPKEFEITALVLAANNKLKKVGAAYYQAQKYLQELTGVELEFAPVGDDMKEYPIVQPYDLKRAALVSIKGGAFLGIIGEFKPSVRSALKLPNYVAGFEVDTEVLERVLAKNIDYKPLPKFPGVKQDITLRVAADLSLQELDGFIWNELGKVRPQNVLHTLKPIDIYQADDDQKHKNVTLRLSIASYERTLTDKEVAKLLDAVAAAAKQTFNAERV